MRQPYHITIIVSLVALLFGQPVSAAHNGVAHGAKHHSEGLSGHGASQVSTMETVVVTAERLDDYIKNHPQLVTILTRREIEQSNYLDLAEAIGTMPGIDVRQLEGSMRTRISIRGSAGSGNILVLFNGRPVNSSQYGSVELSSLPIETVTRVTVFKPPIPVWLGLGGTGGAINIETRQPGGGAASQPRQSGQVKINTGSYGMANFTVTYEGKHGDANIMFTGGGGHRDGKRPNSDKDNSHFSLHWDRRNETTTFLVNGRSFFSEHGVAGPTYNPTPDAVQRYAKGGLDFQIKGFTGESGDFSVKTYFDVTRLEDRSQNGELSTLETIKGGMKGEHVWTAEEGGWALRLGGLMENDMVDHTLSGDHERQHISLHSQLDKELDAVSLSVGLRGDYVSDFDLFPAFFSGVSRSLGRSTLLKVNGGYSVKVPTFGQLYQPSHGSIDQVRGNPDLREEEVWSYSINVEHSLSANRVFMASIFRSDHHDLIAYQRGADFITRPLNLDRAYRHGMELSLKYRITKGFDLDCSYILQRSRISETGKELSYAPRQKGTLSLKHTMPTWQTRCEATIRAASSQYSDVLNTPAEELAGRATVDLKISQPLELGDRSAELYVSIKNLLDNGFESHYGYPDDGLRGMVGLNMKF
ncbi:MAG: TonB-dependent receptor [Desulfobulbaceae bacterium]|nr:TonB-dependent receptor [Desulfobulbaceae bacterium]